MSLPDRFEAIFVSADSDAGKGALGNGGAEERKILGLERVLVGG